MATVPDLSGNNPTDKRLTTYNRSVTASPVGVTTPEYAGEIVLDTVSSKLWKAEGLTNTTWVDFAAAVVHG